MVSVPVVRAVRALYPQARMDLLTDMKRDPNSVSVDKVFDGCGIFENVFFYGSKERFLRNPLALAGTWLSLRKNGYDGLVYLAPNQRSGFQMRRDALVFRSLGIKRIWGLSSSGRILPSSRPLPRLPAEGRTLADRLIHDGLPISVDDFRFDLGISDGEYGALRGKLGQAWPGEGVRVYAACPFTAMPAKKWPLGRYIEVFRRLHKEQGLSPIFLGSKADGAEAEELRRAIGIGYNFTGMSIRESAAIMRRCDFYLGNDTGTMHLAAAEGLRCVAVFSARTYPGIWEPPGSGHRILRTAVPCEGCELTHCVEHKMQCLDLIGADAVYEACESLLGTAGYPPGAQGPIAAGN